MSLRLSECSQRASLCQGQRAEQSRAQHTERDTEGDAESERVYSTPPTPEITLRDRDSQEDIAAVHQIRSDPTRTRLVASNPSRPRCLIRSDQIRSDSLSLSGFINSDSRAQPQLVEEEQGEASRSKGTTKGKEKGGTRNHFRISSLLWCAPPLLLLLLLLLLLA